MGSAPGGSRYPAGVAQLVAQTTCNRQVVGSIPTAGSEIPGQSIVKLSGIGREPNNQTQRLEGIRTGNIGRLSPGVRELHAFGYTTFEGTWRAGERECNGVLTERRVERGPPSRARGQDHDIDRLVPTTYRHPIKMATWVLSLDERIERSGKYNLAR